MIDISKLLEPELTERLRLIDSKRYRQLALYAAERVIQQLGLRDKRISDALELLHAKRPSTFEQKALIELVEILDEAAIDAKQEADESGYNRNFSKARAVNALVSACEPDPEQAVIYTLYEAYYAVDQSLTAVLSWIESFDNENS